MGMGNREWGMGKAENRSGSCLRSTIPYSPFPIPGLSGNRLVDDLRELGAADGADLGRLHLAVLEHHQGRDAAHIVVARGLLVLVDVDLGYLEATAVARREVVEQRRDHLARAAPFGPEVDQHGAIGLEDLILELRVAHMRNILAHGTSPADSGAAGRPGGTTGPRAGRAQPARIRYTRRVRRCKRHESGAGKHDRISAQTPDRRKV